MLLLGCNPEPKFGINLYADCDKCTLNNAHNLVSCTACSNGFFDLLTKSCVSVCPDGYYGEFKFETSGNLVSSTCLGKYFLSKSIFSMQLFLLKMHGRKFPRMHSMQKWCLLVYFSYWG